MIEHATNSAVGLAGTFDLPDHGALLIPRLTERELVERLPRTEFRWLAPFGWERPIPMDGGLTAEPLGRPTDERQRELADQLDALVIGCGALTDDLDDHLAARYAVPLDVLSDRSPMRWFIEGVGHEHEARCPTLWHGVGVPHALSSGTGGALRRAMAERSYVSVRDGHSLARLREAGVEREVLVVPDTTFLIPRLFLDATLHRRRALHRVMGWLPAGEYVVVQGDESLRSSVDEICAALEAALHGTGLAVVAIATGSDGGDVAFSEDVGARIVAAGHPLPATLSGEDVVSLVQGARAVVTGSAFVSCCALACQRPVVILDLAQRPELEALASDAATVSAHVTDIAELSAAVRRMLGTAPDGRFVREKQRELDRHFDRMAVVIERATDGLPGSERAQRRSAVIAAELRALRRAHAVRGRQLVAERSSLSQALESVEQLARAQAARLAETEHHCALLIADRDGLTAVHLELNDAHGALVATHRELVGAYDGLTRDHLGLIDAFRDAQLHAQGLHDQLATAREREARHAQLEGHHAELSRLHDELGRQHDELSRQHHDLQRQHAEVAGRLHRIEGSAVFRMLVLPRRILRKLRR